MAETLKPVPIGANIIRVDNYTNMDVVHGVRLDRALNRLEEVRAVLAAVTPGQAKSVETGVNIPTESGEQLVIVNQTPALHRALANVVFNERQALHESGHEALADEIITARSGIVFEARETRQDHMARTGGD